MFDIKLLLNPVIIFILCLFFGVVIYYIAKVKYINTSLKTLTHILQSYKKGNIVYRFKELDEILTNNKFISSNKGDYNFNVGAGEYGYFAVPSTMKFTTIWVNGFQADVEEVATVSFTNASGHTSTYTILKTSQSSLGTFTATIK